jgi:hypothetical protein
LLLLDLVTYFIKHGFIPLYFFLEIVLGLLDLFQKRLIGFNQSKRKVIREVFQLVQKFLVFLLENKLALFGSVELPLQLGELVLLGQVLFDLLLV